MPPNQAFWGYVNELWKMADALRGSIDPAEYKNLVLVLIFLKYLSDAFEEHQAKLSRGQWANLKIRTSSAGKISPKEPAVRCSSSARQAISVCASTGQTIGNDNPTLKMSSPRNTAA
ncbi:MAG: type I restriction-modification system subunit M N-terminal domain-containing protein [Deltaproteobacteria bacterium]|nr:type I restriction-modification system subunit M N-terminal domain-containing protein [Deltaproteobacteria bacterium]